MICKTINCYLISNPSCYREVWSWFQIRNYMYYWTIPLTISSQIYTCMEHFSNVQFQSPKYLFFDELFLFLSTCAKPCTWIQYIVIILFWVFSTPKWVIPMWAHSKSGHVYPYMEIVGIQEEILFQMGNLYFSQCTCTMYINFGGNFVHSAFEFQSLCQIQWRCTCTCMTEYQHSISFTF